MNKSLQNTEKTHITKLTIDLNNLKFNLDYYKSIIGENVSVLAMVKAQSYGSGIIEVAQFLEKEKINYFGVAYADEGVTLRENEIKTPILVMNPETDAFDEIIEHNLEPSIYTFKVLKDFIKILSLNNIHDFPIHLKIETGMNRLGFNVDEIDELISLIKCNKQIKIKSVFSHLSSADDLTESDYTNQQISTLDHVSNRLKQVFDYPILVHLANSIGAINYPKAHFNMIRIGIGMYGGLSDSYPKSLKPVLSFKSQISQIRQLEAGDSVGYGRAYLASKPTTIAIVPVGYADGLNRLLSNGKWSLIVNGEKAPIVGNVCMDMCMIDVTNINCLAGDDVEIFGPNNPVVELSKVLGTIPYEVISLISRRVNRVYLNDQ